MSPPPNTYSSSLTTPTTVESSTSQDISSSRKSPPPPKLNLDECKHIFSTTTTNTSTNAAVNPSTAFVFTSSRTLPNLYNCSHSTDEVHPHNSSASSPGSLNSSISPGSQPCTPKRPVLSPAQLARHSMGAVDARCIVSPNMRAAGFVPLHHSSPYQPSSLSGPSTSILSPVPTPVDPPRFPPIVFCNPANVTTTPLWDYQRKLQYGLPSGKSAVSASAPVETKSVLARPSIHPLPTTQSKANKITASNSTSYSSMFSNVPSSRSSMTSISSLNVQSPDDDTNSSQYASVRENLADGYPFPATPPRSRTHSHETDPFSTTRKGPLPVAALSSVASSTASVTPLAPLSPTTSVASLPHSTFGSAKGSATSSSASGPLLPAPSQAYARPVPRSSRTGDASSLSMTELYQISPPASWEASSGGSRPESTWGPSGRAAETRREGAKAAALVPSEGPGAVQKVRPVQDETLKEKKREKHRGREKDRETDREKERERRRRQKEKSKRTKSHSSSSPTSSPTASPISTTPSPGRQSKAKTGKVKERARAQPKDRSTKEETLEPPPSFSSFVFPPRDTRAGSGMPHTLGLPDPLLERERARNEAEFAKDAVLAHRERDRELARRHGEREKRSSHKMHVAAVPTAAYASTYNRGRERGIGRGNRGGTRGRGASVSSTSAVSFMSEGTVVQDDSLGSIEQLAEPAEA